MAVLYHQIEQDNFLDWGITELPRVASFYTGSGMRDPMPDPMVFEVSFPTKAHIPHYFECVIPVCSDYLVKTLREAGADNFEAYRAVLKNPKVGEEWGGFWAINVIGIVAAVNAQKSEGDTIMNGDAGGVATPLVAYDTIVLDKKKTFDLPMFRLAESPHCLLIHDRINKYLDDNPPPDGWGFDATEIETV